ncbi:hypothetical protein J6590_026468 [Homalodisca vitripennis]|nr:hypothetical protein J6590_026468 [Homalodisca vitripennis]
MSADLFFDKRVPKRGGGGSTPRLPQAAMVTDLPSFNEHLTPPPSLYRGRLDVLDTTGAHLETLCRLEKEVARIFSIYAEQFTFLSVQCNAVSDLTPGIWSHVRLKIS